MAAEIGVFASAKAVLTRAALTTPLILQSLLGLSRGSSSGRDLAVESALPSFLFTGTGQESLAAPAGSKRSPIAQTG